MLFLGFCVVFDRTLVDVLVSTSIYRPFCLGLELFLLCSVIVILLATLSNVSQAFLAYTIFTE